MQIRDIGDKKMSIFNFNENFFLYFAVTYLVTLVGISTVTIIVSLFVKIQKIVTINKAKKNLNKIKGKPQTIFYKVGTIIEDNIYDLGKCALIIKGFDAVCYTLRRSWNYDDNLKLIYTIKNERTVNVEIFFDNYGNWKTIEGLSNILDGINHVNQYEIVVKENKKVKSIQQMMFIICLTMWIGTIPMLMLYFLTGQFLGIIKYNREELLQILLPIMFIPLLFQSVMYFLYIYLKRYDENSPLLQIVQIYAMIMPVFSVLISFVYWYILLDI